MLREVVAADRVNDICINTVYFGQGRLFDTMAITLDGAILSSVEHLTREKALDEHNKTVERYGGRSESNTPHW